MSDAGIGLVGVLVGGALTVLLRSRAENTQWLRDQRLKTYSAFLHFAFMGAIGEDRSELGRHMLEIYLVGSVDTISAASRVLGSSRRFKEDSNELAVEAALFAGVARKDLGRRMKFDALTNEALVRKIVEDQMSRESPPS
jgi:hypothetical protein